MYCYVYHAHLYVFSGTQQTEMKKKQFFPPTASHSSFALCWEQIWIVILCEVLY